MKRKNLMYAFMVTFCMCILMGMSALAGDADYYIAINLMGKNKTLCVFSNNDDEGELVSASSSNKKVLTVKTEKKDSDDWAVYAKLKKPGKATVKIKYVDEDSEDDEYSENIETAEITIRVYKHTKSTNPFKSLKIGKKNFASKFNKKFCYKKVPVGTSGKLSYSLKKGWKVLHPNPKKGTKVKMKKGSEVVLQVENKKTGVREIFFLTCGVKPFLYTKKCCCDYGILDPYFVEW